jgi:hypothetical protein
MRADVTDCFGPDGAFSIELARQNGLGHLLKVSTTVHRKLAGDGSFLITGDSTKIEFLSPQAAAAQLLKLNSKLDPGPHADSDFQVGDRGEMLERLIASTMVEFPGMTRQDVIKTIADVKPEALKFIRPEPISEAGPDD